jgi:hypothetical protein
MPKGYNQPIEMTYSSVPSFSLGRSRVKPHLNTRNKTENILNKVSEAGVRNHTGEQNEKGECGDKDNAAEEIWQYQRN